MINGLTSKIKKCKYIDNLSFHNLQNFGHSLKLTHLNIRSLHKNFDAMHDFLQSLSFSPDIVYLTETRIKEQPLINISLLNYNFVHANSQPSAGRVAAYISDNLSYELCEKLHQLSNAESIWLKISDLKKSYVIGVIYIATLPIAKLTNF